MVPNPYLHLPQLFETEMDNFFSLFRRYLNDKAKGNAVYVHSTLKYNQTF